MCAKKNANLDFWLTIWLNFERRKIFLETVLHMLLICACHFSWSSTVTPSRRCFETCSIGVVSNFRFKGSCFFWCFCLVAINMHFVFVGFSAIRFLQHHPETSYRLCCKSPRILSILSLAVLRVPSSANKSHWTDARVRHRGKSLIKMQNRSGPRIDPWGTPLVIDVSWEYVPFTSTHCIRSCK